MNSRMPGRRSGIATVMRWRRDPPRLCRFLLALRRADVRGAGCCSIRVGVMLTEHTDAQWLTRERNAEAAWREQSAAEAANARQMRAARLDAKRANKAMRRRESDRPGGADDWASALLVVFVVGMVIYGVFK